MQFRLLDMIQIFLHGMAGFIPAVLFYSVIVMAVIKAKVRVEDAKPAVLYSNQHKYYPQRVFTVYKVVVYVATAIFLSFFLPYILMYIMFNISAPLAFPIAAIFFFAGVVLTVKIIKSSEGNTIESLTIDSSSLTVRYRGGSTETCVCRQYAGYNNAGVSASELVFRDENGREYRLRISGLPDRDMNMLREDFERIQQTGSITVIKKSSAAGAGTQPVQMQQAAICDDPERYAQYLKREAGKLSAELKQELVKMIEAGDNMTAIKLCREWTHLGLKQAKDIVDSYRTCLIDSEVQSMAPITSAVSSVMPAAAQTVTPSEIPAFTPETPASFMSQITAVSGFSFEMTQTGQNNCPWTLRISDKEQPVSDERSLERNIDNALSEIGRKNEEFFVLTPAEPVRGITFMQVCRDKNDVYFHLEAGLTEMNAQGRPKILCKDRLMGWEARNLCMSFYRGDEIYMLSGWDELS